MIKSSTSSYLISNRARRMFINKRFVGNIAQMIFKELLHSHKYFML
jgi:hypothetical protein